MAIAAPLVVAALVIAVVGGSTAVPRPTRRWPVSPYRGIISPFGASRASGTRLHGGVDVGAAPGDAIVAIDDGVVLYPVSGFAIGNGLLALAIRHPDAQYIYAEVASFAVKPGDRVRAGQRIGTAGKNNDGNTMLHLEAWTKAPTAYTPWLPGARPAGLLDAQARLPKVTA